MSPFDIQRFFDGPAVSRCIAGQSCTARLIEDGEIGAGQAEGGIERLQVRGDGGIVISIDDRDGLAGTVGLNGIAVTGKR